MYTDLNGGPAAVIQVTAGEIWHDSAVVDFHADEGAQPLWFVARTNDRIDLMSFMLA